MNPEQLDQKLRTITKHEALYRCGMRRSLLKEFPVCCLDGKEVMQFSYAAISEENNGAPFLVKNILAFAATLYTSMIGSN